MLSLIVPAYNEGEHIYSNLKVIAGVIAKFSDSFELIPVNDGSADNTASEILRAAREDCRIVPVIYGKNRGKGGAIKAGTAAASGDRIGFLDADLDLNPALLEAYSAKMDETGCDIVIGSKMHKDSKLEYPPARRFFSMSYYLIMKLLFGMSVKDTQTGIKLFRADLLKKTVELQRTEGYAFDVEQLALASAMGAVITEMPVVLEYRRGNSFGRIKIGDIFGMFGDTVSIWWNLRVIKSYDLDGRS